MEDFDTYLSALATSGAAILASAGFMVGDFLLKHMAPQFHSDWAKGELGRVALVVLVSGGILVAGYSVWHAPYKTLQELQSAEKQSPPAAATPAISPVAPPRPAAAQLQAGQPVVVASARPTDAQINSGLNSLLFRATLIESEAGSFRGNYDQAAVASRITGWQTEAAVFLRNNVGPEAEKDFRTVDPVAPNSQVGALLNGSAANAAGMFTAQREVLKAYRR